MSRAWEKAKKGALWLGLAGVIVGGGLGLLGGVILGGVTIGVGGAAAGGLILGLAEALKWGVSGFVLGGAIGGVYGAVTEDPAAGKGSSAPSPAVAKERSSESVEPVVAFGAKPGMSALVYNTKENVVEPAIGVGPNLAIPTRELVPESTPQTATDAKFQTMVDQSRALQNTQQQV